MFYEFEPEIEQQGGASSSHTVRDWTLVRLLSKTKVIRNSVGYLLPIEYEAFQSRQDVNKGRV